MVLTTAPTVDPAVDKLFSYQVSSGIVNQVSNLMYDGNFNNYGNPSNTQNSANNWQTTSGTNTYNFSKTVTADSTGGQAFSFNGNNSYIQLSYSSYGAGFNDISYQGSLARTFAMRAYKSNWQSTAMECLFYNKVGFLMVNQIPGYLTYYINAPLPITHTVGLNAVSIPLSSLTNGWHNIVFGYDGNNLYLDIDNGALSANSVAGGFSLHNVTNAAAAAYLGCFAYNLTGSLSLYLQYDVQQYFFTGAIKYFASWAQTGIGDALTTIRTLYNQGEAYANTSQIGVTYAQLAGLDNHYTFDNDTTTACFDVIQGIQGTPVNCTLLTGSTNTSSWYNSRSLFVPLNNPGATAVGFKGNSAISTMLMNFTNYQYFLGMAIKGVNLGGTGVVTISVTDGTHTWSTNLTIAQLNISGWQNFSWGFIPSQYKLSSNAYVSVAITGNCTGTLYFDHIIVSPSIATPYFDLVYQDPTIRSVSYNNTTNQYVGTQYTYNYLTNWHDVGSLPTISEEVGTLGSQITLILNRDPNNCGEGYDLKLDNRVYITMASPNSPGGVAYFDGYIADYTQDFTKNNVQVILMSWGNQAANFLLLAGSAPAVQNPSFNSVGSGIYTPQRWATNNSIGIVLAITTAPTQTTIAGLQVYMQTSQAGQSDVLTCGIYSTLSGAAGYNGSGSGGALLNNGNIGGAIEYVTQNIVYAAAMQKISFTFNTPVNCSPNTTYYFYLASQLQASAGGVGWVTGATDANSSYYLIQGQAFGGNSTTLVGSSLQYSLLGANNSATVLYTKQDPSAILINGLNNLRSQGVNLQYTSSSIDTVGQNVTYQFQTATGADLINQISTLCPPGWFTYIDQTTNTVHLHQYSSRTVHKLLLGTHIKALTFEKRMDTMVNTIYFTGGQDPSNPGYTIFRTYQNAGSVALYGVRMKTVTDNRVTLAQTADIVAQSYLNVNPEIRTVIEVSDKAYNIDSFLLGDEVNFGGFLNGEVENWDMVNWGVNNPSGKWDFDITSPETLYLYIERIDSLVDTVQLTLSTTPPDVNKKLQATLNSLLKTYTLSNPPTPTTGTNLIT